MFLHLTRRVRFSEFRLFSTKTGTGINSFSAKHRPFLTTSFESDMAVSTRRVTLEDSDMAIGSPFVRLAIRDSDGMPYCRGAFAKVVVDSAKRLKPAYWRKPRTAR